jgi:hypothetical protein
MLAIRSNIKRKITMHKIISTTLLTSALFISVNALANKPTVNCPPLAVVNQHVTFSMAENVFSSWWMLADTNQFNFDNKNWVVAFAMDLPGVKNDQDALTQGQAFFNAHVTLGDPDLIEDTCAYAFKPGKFAVFAVNDQDNQLHAAKFLK